VLEFPQFFGAYDTTLLGNQRALGAYPLLAGIGMQNNSEGYNTFDYSLLQDSSQTATKTSHPPISTAAAAALTSSTSADSNPLKVNLESMGSSDYEMKVDEYLELQTLPGNDVCADCGVNKQPDWGSPALGILFCFQCSGIHR
jgi:Putative GTPase activating protein for Arf